MPCAVCSSVESPSASSEHVNEALAAARAQHDSDLEVEDLPPLKQVLGDDVCKKLKPKEKKRQEVINGESPWVQREGSAWRGHQG